MSEADPIDKGIFIIIMTVIIGGLLAVIVGLIMTGSTPENVQIEQQKTKRFDRLIRMIHYSSEKEKQIIVEHIETLIKAADLTENQVKELKEKSLGKGDGVEAESEREPAEGR